MICFCCGGKVEGLTCSGCGTQYRQNERGELELVSESSDDPNFESSNKGVVKILPVFNREKNKGGSYHG